MSHPLCRASLVICAIKDKYHNVVGRCNTPPLDIIVREMSEAFARTELLIGSVGLARLASSTVAVFGLGGVGSYAAEALAYLARAKGRTDAFLLLVIYNLCFIAPLLVVFAASYFGVSSKKITAMFQKRMGAIKLSLAAVFVVLAVLTLLT